ncbi:unnamed protein product [Amoebophrya sp. A120]|nr:unnamed protein product [Amoebophrya sp. A120]|eukprot:GSA120T00021116001.1
MSDVYAVLKRRLAELHYTEHFPHEAAPIVDHLLQDLLKSVESFHLLKQRYEDSEGNRQKDVAKFEENARRQTAALEERFNREKRALQDQLEQQKSLGLAKTQNNEEAEVEIRQLRDRLRKAEQMNEANASTSTAAFDNLKQAHNNLKHDLAALQTRYQMQIEKEAEYENKIEKLTQLTKEHSTIENSVMEKHAQFVSCNNELAELKVEMGEMRNQKKQKEDELKTTQEELSSVKSQFTVVQLRLDAALKSPFDDGSLNTDARVQELEQLVERITADLAQSNAEKVNTRTQLALKTAELEETEQQLRQWKLQNHSTSISASSTMKQSEKMQSQVSELMQSLHDLKDEKGSLQKYLEERLLQLGAKDAEIASLNYEVSSLRGDLEQQLAAISELKKSQQAELEARRKRDEEAVALKSEEMELKASHASAKRLLNDAQERIALLETERTSLQTECSTWVEKLKESKREKADLEEKLEKAMRTEMSKESDIVRLTSEHSKSRKEQDLENASLKIENEKLLSRNESLQQELKLEKQQLLDKVAQFNQEMTSIQQEVLSLAEQNQDLILTKEKSEIIVTNEKKSSEKLEVLVTELQKEKKLVEEKCDTIEKELQELKSSKSLQSFTMDQTETKLNAFEQERIVFVKEMDRLRQELKEKEKVTEAKKSDYTFLEKGNEELSTKNSELKEKCVNLEAEKSQLTSLMTALEHTREQLVQQLQETQRVLDFERQSRSEMLSTKEKKDEILEEKQITIQSLQSALKELDKERDSLQSIADEKAQENRVLELQLEESNKAESALQNGIEELRRKLDVSSQQLTDREKQLSEQSERILNLNENLEQQRADNLNYRRDLDLYAEDLSVMTRENATLNEELSVLQRDREVFSAEKSKSDSMQQTYAQQLKKTELERDDMIQLYKEIVEESQRQEKTIKQLTVEREESSKKLSDYSVRNKALIDAEERALSAARQEGLNVVALKQQVSDLCQRLEGLTQEAEEKLRREREFEQEIFVSGQAVKEVELRRFNLERDLAASRAQQDRSLIESTRLKNDLQQEKELTKLERQRNKKLEALLAEVRKSSSNVNDSGAAVGGQDRTNTSAITSTSLMNATSLNATTIQNATTMEKPINSTATGGTADLQTLYKTLDQQYALIGEMDAENVRLTAENEELKKRTAPK